MSEPLDAEVCSQCGATQERPLEKCWLCGAAISSLSSPDVSVSTAPKKQPYQAYSFSLFMLLLIMTLASVCMGLIITSPGLGVLVCVLLVPVLVRTVRVVRHRETVGEPVSNAEKVRLFLASFGVASSLVVVISIAILASLGSVCMLVFAGNDDQALPWAIGLCALAMAAFVLIIGISRWIYRRYRRDMRQD